MGRTMEGLGLVLGLAGAAHAHEAPPVPGWADPATLPVWLMLLVGAWFAAQLLVALARERRALARRRRRRRIHPLQR